MSQLKIISWNIWGGKNLDEIIEFLRRADADIVGLQEVLQDEDGSNNDAQKIAEALGYEWVFVNTKTLTPDISHLLKEHGIAENKGWGNAILSRHHIESSQSYTLSDMSSRTAVEVIIQTGDVDVHVYSTHLVHSKHPLEKRLEQTVNLLRIISKERTVVMGDFNATPESEVVQRMQKDLSSVGNDLSRSTLRDEQSHIDYIFTSKDMHIVTSDILQSEASDHFPIVAIVEL